MRSPRLFSPLVLVLLVGAACGDDGGSAPPDAQPPRDSGPHPDVLPAGCDYLELRDDANDNLYGMGTPEGTGLTFATSTTVCGVFEATHYIVDEQLVDLDAYTLELASAADVLITIHGPGAEALALAGVEFYASGAQSPSAIADIFGSHGVTAVRLEAGTYELLVFAFAKTEVTAPIAYKIQIASDSPDTRCPDLTTGGYTEMNDGPTNAGNDVVSITFGPGGGQVLTTPPTDEPDNMAAPFAIGPATTQRVTGSLADIAMPDSYEDKDTYVFTTDAATNQLAVRLTWPGTTFDLDYFLFEAEMVPAFVRAATTATTGPELKTFVVKPSTTYWLFVGADATSTGLPVTYNATICGAQFAP